MAVWEFTLIVEGQDVARQEVHDALYESGCDDALIGQANGVQYLDFDRRAQSLEDAVASAVRDIEQVPGIEVVRFVDSDLVNMTEIAERTNRTRESVRLLVTGKRGRGGFPPPVSDPRRPHRLWRWSEVERWVKQGVGDSDRRSGESTIRIAISAGIELNAATRRLNVRQRERVFDIARRA